MQGFDNSKEAKVHFWAVLDNFKDLMMISKTADGKQQHARPMHVTSVCITLRGSGLCLRLAKAKEGDGIYFFTFLKSPKVEEVQHDCEVTLTGQSSNRWLYLTGIYL